MGLLFSIGYGLAGVGMILVGARWLTGSISDIAKKLAISNAAVGLVFVSILLSIPEVVVAVMSVAKNHAVLALGAILGSVSIDLGLTSGLSAIIRPLAIPRISIVRDLSFMMLATILVSTVALEDKVIDSLDGFAFIIMFAIYVGYVLYLERKANSKIAGIKREFSLLELAEKQEADAKAMRGVAFFVTGGILLIIGADFFTNTLILFSQSAKLPDLVIGLTIGSLGTSIPTIAAALEAAKRGHGELAFSESIGSNIFSLLVSLGVMAEITPLVINSTLSDFTFPILIATSLLFTAFVFKGTIGKKEGTLLIGVYLITTILRLVLLGNG